MGHVHLDPDSGLDLGGLGLGLLPAVYFGVLFPHPYPEKLNLIRY